MIQSSLIVPIGTEKNLIETHTPNAVNTYRTGKSTAKYFRYSYHKHGKIHHHHIKGGNILNPLAQKRAEEIKKAIAKNLPPDEIIKIIKSW
jgi:hypothetical protein